MDCELFTVYNLGLTRRKGKKSALERDVYATSLSSTVRALFNLILEIAFGAPKKLHNEGEKGERGRETAQHLGPRSHAI